MGSSQIGDHSSIRQLEPYELWTRFEAATDLPTLPEVALRLQHVVNDPNSSAKDVARIIEDDPAIATKVLKVVNSALYSTQTRARITQLQPAIARLGFLAVSNIALSTSVFEAFSQVNNPVFNRHDFWRHSVCVGIITSVLNDYCADVIVEDIRRDTAHLAGIIHDIGKILFERYANLEFHVAIEQSLNNQTPAIQEEAAVISVGHDEAGAWLGNKWGLGEDMIAVIQWHHDPMNCPNEKYRWLVKLVHMADYIAHNQQMGDSGNPSPSYDPRVREELELSSEIIAELMDDVRDQAQKSDILLSLGG